MWKLYKERWYLNGGVNKDTHLVETESFDTLEEAQKVMSEDFNRLSGSTTSSIFLKYSFLITRKEDNDCRIIQYGILKE